MSGEERVYGLLLRAYPAPFRDDYAGQMLQVFRDLRRDRPGIMQFWSRILWDVVRSAPALRLEMSRARRSHATHPRGDIMKTISILAVIVGAITIVNATLEGWTGGLVNHDIQSIVAWCLGGLAGVSLLAAGAMLLMKSSDAKARAQVAGIVCLLGFALMLVVSPRMSVFANLLGIGFPLILIGYVQFSGGTGRSTPLLG